MHSSFSCPYPPPDFFNSASLPIGNEFVVLAIELAFDLHVLLPSLNLYLPALWFILLLFIHPTPPHDLGCELFEKKVCICTYYRESVVNEACVNSLVTTAVSFFPDLE